MPIAIKAGLNGTQTSFLLSVSIVQQIQNCLTVWFVSYSSISHFSRVLSSIWRQSPTLWCLNVKDVSRCTSNGLVGRIHFHFRCVCIAVVTLISWKLFKYSAKFDWQKWKCKVTIASFVQTRFELCLNSFSKTNAWNTFTRLLHPAICVVVASYWVLNISSS